MDGHIQAGDMLLVPRGWVHYAKTTGINSLHFTLSAVRLGLHLGLGLVLASLNPFNRAEVLAPLSF